jgi:hypothetical protein
MNCDWSSPKGEEYRTKIIIKSHLVNESKNAVTNQNYIHEIKSSLVVPSAIKNLNVKTKIYPLLFWVWNLVSDYRGRTWMGGGSLRIRCWEEHLAPRDIMLPNEEFHTLYFLPNIIRMINQGGWISHGYDWEAWSEETTRKPRRRWEDNIKIDLKREGVDWFHVVQDRDRWKALVNTVINFRVQSKAENLWTNWATTRF